MKSFLLIAFYFCSMCFIYSQSKSEQNKTYNFSANVGVGINKFAITGWETEDYPSMATRLGFSVSRNVIGNRVQLQSGMNLYFRAKSKSPLVDEIYWYGKGSLYPLLDKTATQRHVAFEVPISLRYILSGDKSVNLGLLYRKWQPKDHRPISFLASQNELGLTFGLSQKVIERISLGLDFFIGFKDFDPTLIIGSSTNVVIRDRSALFSIAYSF